MISITNQQDFLGGVRVKTLMVTIQKGGQGKTMLACHLARYAASHGIKTLFLDLDVQANSSWTLANYASGVSASSFIAGEFSNIPIKNNLALIAADAELANFEEGSIRTIRAKMNLALKRCDKQFDLCVIDTPPTLGLPIISAGSLADFAVAPLELEMYSLQGVTALMKILENLKEKNPKLEFLGIVPNRFSTGKPRLVQNLKYLEEGFGNLVVPFQIPNRDSIAEALGNQSSIWDSRKTSARIAKKSLASVCNYLINKMDI